MLEFRCIIYENIHNFNIYCIFGITHGNGKQFLIFGKIIFRVTGVLLDPEDEGNIDLQNIANYSPVRQQCNISEDLGIFWHIFYAFHICPCSSGTLDPSVMAGVGLQSKCIVQYLIYKQKLKQYSILSKEIRSTVYSL